MMAEKISALDFVNNIYHRFVTSDEVRALERKGKPIVLLEGVPEVIKRDQFSGMWHDDVPRPDGKIMSANAPNETDRYVIMSPDVLDENSQLLEKGNHERVILLMNKELEGVNIGLNYDRKSNFAAPMVSVKNYGEIEAEIKGMCDEKGGDRQGGPDREVNKKYFMVFCLSNEKETKISFKGGEVSLIGAPEKAMKIVFRKVE